MGCNSDVKNHPVTKLEDWLLRRSPCRKTCKLKGSRWKQRGEPGKTPSRLPDRFVHGGRQRNSISNGKWGDQTVLVRGNYGLYSRAQVEWARQKGISKKKQQK